MNKNSNFSKTLLCKMCYLLFNSVAGEKRMMCEMKGLDG